MKKGLTLIETIIALGISSILFLVIFQLTNRSFQNSTSVIKDTINIKKDLQTLLNYENNSLTSNDQNPIPFTLVTENIYLSPSGVKLCIIR